MYRDNREGGFQNLAGASINYASKSLTIPTTFSLATPEPIWVKNGGRYWFAGFGPSILQPAYLPNTANVEVKYLYGDEQAEVEEVFALNHMLIDLAENTSEHLVPASAIIDFGGHRLIDRDGAIIADHNPATGGGTAVGTFDYEAARATFTQWLYGISNGPSAVALLTTLGSDTVDAWAGRTPANPIKSLQFTIRATTLAGDALSATADANGLLSGDGIEGKLDYRLGVYFVRFGAWVSAAGQQAEHWYDVANVVNGQVWKPLPVVVASIHTDCISQIRIAMRADVTGIDPSLLPPGGELPQFREDDLVSIHHTGTVVVTTPLAGTTLTLGRGNLDAIWVEDAGNNKVPVDRFTATEADLVDGTVHWVNVDHTDHPLPWTVYHRIWDIGTVGDISGNRLILRDKGVEQAFPEGSYVSTLLFFGDMKAYLSVPFFQTTWNGVWSDTRQGSAPLAAYDYLTHPIECSNDGTTLKARVALIFRTPTTYDCYIENYKKVGSGVSIYEDFSPINDATGKPFFTIRGSAGDAGPFGAGWAAGYVMRFNMIPAVRDVKFMKCLQPSAATGEDDVFAYEFRGDIDRP